MPELPEVQTTVDGLNKTVKGFIIKEVSPETTGTNEKIKEALKILGK